MCVCTDVTDARTTRKASAHLVANDDVDVFGCVWRVWAKFNGFMCVCERKRDRTYNDDKLTAGGHIIYAKWIQTRLQQNARCECGVLSKYNEINWLSMVSGVLFSEAHTYIKK